MPEAKIQTGVEFIPTRFIGLKDGRRLALRLWLPAGARQKPVPAVLEYHPYRFLDGTNLIDSQTHPWLAAHGLAAVRADIHGSGESEGLMKDEYTEQELSDAQEILSWLAAQPWCSGDIAMMGSSWGGFNALMLAALRPEELKTIVCLAFSDDRYVDDIHYMGGCLLTQNFGWSMAMTALNSRPPDPAVTGPGWRAAWQERLTGHQPFIATWLGHNLKDDYWKRGSVCQNYEDIRIPVYALSGWADPYTNCVPRLVANLATPARGIVGPWAHQYPHISNVGPKMGFLQDIEKWFNKWLKETEPALSKEKEHLFWVQEGGFSPEGQGGLTSNGYWISFDDALEAHTRPRYYRLSKGKLKDGEGLEIKTSPIEISTPNTLGGQSGVWCPYGEGQDLPGDQQADDEMSVVFETDPLTETLTICGRPELDFEFRCDQPRAFICARLCEVDPSGRSTLVSYGLLNLTNSDDHETSTPLQPGQSYQRQLKLNYVTHAFKSGARIRLALSTTYWPLVWPSPQPATVSLDPARTMFQLPVLEEPRRFEIVEPFEPAQASEPEAHRVLEAGAFTWTAGSEEGGSRQQITVVSDTGLEELTATNTLKREVMKEIYLIDSDDPLSAEMQSQWTMIRQREGWNIRTEVWGRMRATAEAYLIEVSTKAFEDGELVFEKGHRFEVERSHT